MKHDEIIKRGHDALKLLADETLEFFLEEYERDIKTISFGKASTDEAERTSVYIELRTLSRFRGRLLKHAKKAEELLRAPIEEEDTEPYDD